MRGMVRSPVILAAGPGSPYGGPKQLDPGDHLLHECGLRRLVEGGVYPERLWQG